MAVDQKISELSPITAANIADDDELPIVDTSASETKKAIVSELKKLFEPRRTTAVWHTQNGHGSINAFIQKFTTEVIASDNIIVTVVNSATLGFSITANVKCKLWVKFGSSFSSQNYIGLSKNTDTGNVSTLTANRLALAYTTGANVPSECSAPGVVLEIGDVVRTHTNGTSDGSTPAFSSVHIMAEEIFV